MQPSNQQWDLPAEKLGKKEEQLVSLMRVLQSVKRATAGDELINIYFICHLLL